MSFPANDGLPSMFNVRISLNFSFLKRIEPNKPAYITEIGDDYESRRNAVGGLIEMIPFLHDPDAVMVGNEEAHCRFIEGIVAGPFFICGDNGKDFCSLTDEQCEKYVQLFSQSHEISQDEVEQDMRITLIGF